MKFFLTILIPFTGLAQDLTGTWMGLDGREKLVIIHIGDSCFGYTYDEGLGYCKANFIGTYNKTSKKLKGTNTSFIEHTATHTLSNYRLNYAEINGAAYLSGRAGAKTLAAKIASIGLKIPLYYKKISDTPEDTTQLIATKINTHIVKEVSITHTQDSDTMHYPAELLTQQKNNRVSKTINTIYTDADSIRLVLFDNGEIDNDTVTVFVNGKIALDRLGLTATMKEYIIPFHKSENSLLIELMANNLGSIPPNTANLQIYSGKEKHELKVSADYNVNAAIEIRRKE